MSSSWPRLIDAMLPHEKVSKVDLSTRSIANVGWHADERTSRRVKSQTEPDTRQSVDADEGGEDHVSGWFGYSVES